MDLPQLASLFWGKSPKGNQPAHGLLAHLLDVAACALALLAREPQSTRRQFALSPHAWG